MLLNRSYFQELEKWYSSPALRRNPCILFGARQVGKTTLARSFAEKTGRTLISVNFWKDPNGRFHDVFNSAGAAPQVLEKLQLIFGREIDQDKCILLLDEIQDCRAAYSLCKSFKEDTNIPVIATGSYLKLMLGPWTQDDGFRIPVGCTHELLVTPLSFAEFLENYNKLFMVTI